MQGAEKIWRDPKHATVYLKDLAKTSSVKSTTEAARPKYRDVRSLEASQDQTKASRAAGAGEDDTRLHEKLC